MSYEDLYRFTFAADATDALGVSQMFEVEGRRTKLQRTTGSEFQVEQDVDGAVLSVTQTQTQRGKVDVKSYSDIDGDGLFTKDYEIEVASSSRGLERHKFTFDLNGQVTQDLEQKGRGWKNDRITSNESYEEMDVDGVSYVVKTTTDWDEVEFEIFRDDNGDGIYTQIAEGDTQSDAFLDVNGNVDFAAIQVHLAPADAIIG